MELFRTETELESENLSFGWICDWDEAFFNDLTAPRGRHHLNFSESDGDKSKAIRNLCRAGNGIDGREAHHSPIQGVSVVSVTRMRTHEHVCAL